MIVSGSDAGRSRIEAPAEWLSPLRLSLGKRIVCLHEFQVSRQNRSTGGFDVVLSFRP